MNEIFLAAKKDRKRYIRIWWIKIIDYFCILLKREHSSAGSEHLPYKQRVLGSNPCAPTTERFQEVISGTFFIFYFLWLLFISLFLKN